MTEMKTRESELVNELAALRKQISGGVKVGDTFKELDMYCRVLMPLSGTMLRCFAFGRGAKSQERIVNKGFASHVDFLTPIPEEEYLAAWAEFQNEIASIEA